MKGMKENKYYIPSLEEFYVDFEYECKENFQDGKVKTQKDFDNVKWKKEIVENLNDFPYIQRTLTGKNSDNNLCGIRVKFLDKEDIESLGFTDKEYKEFRLPDSFYKIDKDDNVTMIKPYFNMTKLTRENLVRIYIGKLYSYPYTEIFRGNIKNKSELKKVLQMLNINYNERKN